MTYHLERRSKLFGLLFTIHKQHKRQIWGLVRNTQRRAAHACAVCGQVVGGKAYRPIGLVSNKTARICEGCGGSAPVREVPDQS